MGTVCVEPCPHRLRPYEWVGGVAEHGSDGLDVRFHLANGMNDRGVIAIECSPYRWRAFLEKVAHDGDCSLPPFWQRRGSTTTSQRLH